MKISENELKKLQSEGAVVKRKMGKAEKPEPVEESVPEPVQEAPPQPHASMGASMQAFEAQAEATRIVIAQNGEMMRQFVESLKEVVTPREPSPYTFDIKRDDEDRMTQVLARPGIEEEA
jgi:hypothetical protein